MSNKVSQYKHGNAGKFPQCQGMILGFTFAQRWASAQGKIKYFNL